MKLKLWKKFRSLSKQLKRLQAALDSLTERMENMASQVSQDLKDLAAKFDAATDEIAADLAALRDKIKNSMTDTEVEEVKATIQAKIDRLTVLGQDPVDPVPPA